MKRPVFLIILLISKISFAQTFSKLEISRWSLEAKRVTITRDQWGIPHIEGKTDADAVFGLMYAQCEDDFQRIELNYIEKLGRLSEINGETNIYNDLQIRLLIDETEAKKEYFSAEPWLKKILEAYSDGINYFLLKHTEVKPKLLTRFEPWYPLLWTDGSIGAISTADLTVEDLKAFYNGSERIGFQKPNSDDFQQTGSNGFALAPKLTLNGKAMLYINPHTTFYFRPEVHVKSNEGLNVYGAVTWGQFFVYQGFNEYCGWMHTSSNADVADTYFENIIEKNGKRYYTIDGKEKPIIEKKIRIKYLENGEIKSKIFEGYFTRHGPIMAKRDGKWISLKSYNRAKNSLVQSWTRTKAKGLEDYKKAMELKANTSNNTVFADKHGNIAYWHGNYMPKRDNTLNWSKTQDGSISKNDYKGMHSVNEVLHIYNPKNGWIQNCNSTPFTASGVESPKKENYPGYMAPDGENFRAVNAIKLLSKAKNMDLDKLIDLGYDNYLSAFEVLIPRLISIKSDNPEIQSALDLLKDWNYRVNENSIEASLAIEWAQKLSPALRKVYVDQGEKDQVENTKWFAANGKDEEFINPLKDAMALLTQKHCTWKVKWGDLNRFQRLANSSEFDDNAPSLPMRNASALWGCLPSFNSKYYQDSKKRYGYNGNSFVCAVEFGEKVKAKSLLAGGNSGNATSANFNDQAEIFTKGKFKEVLFYPEDIKKHTVRKYFPGE